MVRPFAVPALTLTACALFVATPAFAQKKPAPLPPPPVQPAAPAPVTLPPPPSVNDPMLTPVPPAAKSVATWDDVTAQLRANSTDLKTALADVLRAEGQWRTALAGTLPSLNGTVSARKELLTNETVGLGGIRIESPNPDVTANGSLTLSQPVFAPRTWHGIKTASLATDVAQLGVAQSKREIALRAAGAVIAVVTAERVAELNRIGFRTALERLDLATRKRALGAGTGLDVLRAQQDVEQARATIVSGDESLRQAREALGLALGLAEPVGVAADINLDGIQRAAGAACKPAASLDERADLAAARGRRDLSERGISDVKWQYAPTANLQSTLATTTANTGLSPNTTWNIQGVVSFPLWEGGARYGATRTAEADLARSENTLLAAKRAASVDVTQAVRAVTVAEAARKVAADARALAAESERLARAGYLEGQGTSLELIIAAQGLRQAEVTLALKEFDLVRARIVALLASANCTY